MAGRGEALPEVEEVDGAAPAPAPAPQASKPASAQPGVNPDRPGVVKRLLGRRRKSR
jgi:hypothetical protein